MRGSKAKGKIRFENVFARMASTRRERLTPVEETRERNKISREEDSIDKTISGMAPSIGPGSATASNSHIGDAAEAESMGGKQSVDGSLKGRSSKFLPETGASSAALVGLGPSGASETENPVPVQMIEHKSLRIPKIGTQVFKIDLLLIARFDACDTKVH